MLTPNLRVLLRVATELFCRSHFIKCHLREVRSLPAPEYEQLADAVQDTLDAVVQGPVVEAIEEIPSLSEEYVIPPLFDALKRFSRWFAVAHELLVYLPAPTLLPETGGILKKLFHDASPGLQPSIILGSLFNAFEFDFYRNLTKVLPDFREISPPTGTKPVLQQPICDRRSPAGWAVLAHEMGHAIDNAHQISTTAMQQLLPGMDDSNKTYMILSKWAKEFCADLIAAEICGPAAILSILSIEYCVYPLREVHQYTKTHPSTKWRFDLVSQYLQRRHTTDFIDTSRGLYEDAWTFSLARSFPDKSQRDQFVRIQQQIFDNMVQPLANILGKNLSTHVSGSDKIDQSSIDRCLRRLSTRLPIGSQGKPRETLRARIQSYRDDIRAKEFPSDETRVTAFRQLVQEFQEEPLSGQSLLLSFARRREQILDEATDRLLANCETGMSWLLDQVTRADELAVRSVSTAMIEDHHVVPRPEQQQV